VSQGKRNHNICDIRLDCGSEGNILKKVLIIRLVGYESRAGYFPLLHKVLNAHVPDLVTTTITIHENQLNEDFPNKPFVFEGS
jgi:hypothetical protein